MGHDGVDLVRYAWVDPNTVMAGDDRTELTLGANWFFSGHDNKITFDLSRLTLELPGEETSSENRVRVQWDISF